MAGGNELEIYRQHITAQQKYTYFLLAAVGACVGFALTQTKDLPFDQSQLPLAIALLGWALSFWCGCVHLKAVQATLYTNMGLIRLQLGRDPNAGHHPELMAYGSQVISEIAEKHSSRSSMASSWQLRFFILGVIAYIYWHISEMVARIPAPLPV